MDQHAAHVKDDISDHRSFSLWICFRDGLPFEAAVKLPIILPSVLAVFALNFNALFTEYDMSATSPAASGGGP